MAEIFADKDDVAVLSCPAEAWVVGGDIARFEY